MTTIEGLPLRTFVALAAASIAIPGVLAAWAPEAWMSALFVVISGVAAFGFGWAAQQRRLVAELPLEVAKVAVRTRVNGVPAYQFRLRLGRGRQVRDATAEVWWHPAVGAPRALELVVTPGPRIGPWTVLALDRESEVSGGQFVLRAKATTDAQAWEAEQRVSDVRDGRFSAAVVPAGAGWRFEAEQWASVVGSSANS